MAAMEAASGRSSEWRAMRGTAGRRFSFPMQVSFDLARPRKKRKGKESPSSEALHAGDTRGFVEPSILWSYLKAFKLGGNPTRSIFAL